MEAKKQHEPHNPLPSWDEESGVRPRSDVESDESLPDLTHLATELPPPPPRAARRTLVERLLWEMSVSAGVEPAGTLHRLPKGVAE